MVDIDAETVFNWSAGLLATAGVLFFLFNVDAGLSPVTTALLVVAFVAGVFALAQRTADAELRTVGYAVAVVAVVGLFADTINTVGATSAVTAAGLLLLAAVLFLARSRLDETGGLVDGRRATLLFGVVAGLAVLVLVGDVATGGLGYELRAAEEVRMPDDREDEIRVATLVVSNPTPLPERVDAPRYRACAAGDWSEYRRGEPGEPPEPVELHASVEEAHDDYLLGLGERRYPVVLHVGARNVTGETFPVRLTDACPGDDSGSPYVALFPAADSYSRPV